MDLNSVIDWVVLNLPFLIMAGIFIAICFRAVKDGFISEFFSFVCALLASLAILLLAIAVHDVFNNKRLQFVVALVLLVLLGIINRMLNLIFDPIRLIAKLPVLKVIDKIAGIVMALFETVVVLWAVYCVIIIVGAGSFGDWVLRCVRSNPFMRTAYEYNYLYKIVLLISDKMRSVDIWNRLGM